MSNGTLDSNVDIFFSVFDYVNINYQFDHFSSPNVRNPFLVSRSEFPFSFSLFSSKNKDEQKEERYHQEISKRIDKQLKDYKKLFDHRTKVVFVAGTRNSGVSTVLKQLRFQYGEKFDTSELNLYAYLLRIQTIEEMKKLILITKTLDLCYSSTQKEEIASEILYSSVYIPFTKELADQLSSLWVEDVTQRALDIASKVSQFVTASGTISIDESVCSYFFTNVKRFAEPDFKPTLRDILHVKDRIRSKSRHLRAGLDAGVTPSKNMSLDPSVKLPFELVVVVCTYLDASSIINVSCVNRRWNTILKISSVWETLVKSHFDIHLDMGRSEYDWKRTYYHASRISRTFNTVRDEKLDKKNTLYNYWLVKAKLSNGTFKKWLHFFDSAWAIVFIFDLSNFSKKVSDKCPDRYITRQVKTFAGVCNSSKFRSTPVVVVLNKTDVLQQKIERLNSSKGQGGSRSNVDRSLSQIKDVLRNVVINAHRLTFLPYSAIDPKGAIILESTLTKAIVESKLQSAGIKS